MSVVANAWWLVEYTLSQGNEPLGQFALHVVAPSRELAMYRAKELIFDKCLAGPQYDGRSFQINRVEPLSDKHAAYTADSAVSWWSLGYSLHREDRLIGIGDLLARDRSWRRAEATLSAILSARYSAPEVLVETGVPVSVELPWRQSDAQQATQASNERRERIATAVLSGLLASGRLGVDPGETSMADRAQDAVQWADALIAELDKPQGETK